MFKNYFKIALRNFMKYKAYSIINVVGLATAISVFSVIFIFIKNELSYDQHHQHGDQVYKVIEIQIGKGFGTNHVSWTMGPLAAALKADFPEVEYATRLSDGNQHYCQIGDKEFLEYHICHADPDLLAMFTIPLIMGDSKTALNEPNSVIIRQEIAKKYFGNGNPLGQTITVNNQLFKITGVLEDEHHRSHMKYNMLLSYSTLNPEDLSLWFSNRLATYIMLRDGTTSRDVEKKLPEFLMKYRQIENDWEENLQMYLQPLKKIHLYSQHILFACHNFNRGNINNVIIFSAIALLIILIACINFTNLSTARASQRTKEIGIRKVCGSNRRQLISQFWGESILLSLGAFLLVVVLIECWMPVLNSLLNESLTLHTGDYFSIFMVTLVVGMFAGWYPALYMSQFQPTDVLKKFSKSGSNISNLRKFLVIAQFTISIFLITSTIVVFNQRQYIQNKDLGYNKENILCINLAGEEGRSKLELLKNELNKHNNIVSVAATSRPGGGGLGQSTFSLAEKPDQSVLMEIGSIDVDYIPTMGMTITAGRNFSEEFVSDNDLAIIINESAVEKFGVDDVIGKRFKDETWGGKIPIIVGIVKNFHFYTLHEEIRPFVFGMNPDYYRSLIVNVKPYDIQATINYMKDVWNKLVPSRPFQYWFLDESLENQYRVEENMNRLFLYFSAFAIFISCLGLLGLSAFAASQRTKEIGIRKVLGAPVMGLISMLYQEFTKWIVLANLFAWPIAYFVMSNWLQNFAYRIDMSWWMFALAGGLALVIALLTVSWQALRAATANPVKALRYE